MQLVLDEEEEEMSDWPDLDKAIGMVQSAAGTSLVFKGEAVYELPIREVYTDEFIASAPHLFPDLAVNDLDSLDRSVAMQLVVHSIEYPSFNNPVDPLHVSIRHEALLERWTDWEERDIPGRTVDKFGNF